MGSSRFRPLTAFVLALAAIAPGCAQFPTLSRRSVPSEPVGVDILGRSQGMVELGEDPAARLTPANAEQRRTSLLLTRVRLSLADGDTETAARLLESIPASDPEHAEASRLLGVLRTRGGELELAERHFQTALARDDGNARLHSDYGYFCYLVGRWEDAERHLGRAIEIDPALPEAQTNLGMLEARLGDVPSARQRFRNAGCTEAEVLNNLAFARLLEEDYATAASTYRRAQELDPENSNVRTGLRVVNYISETDGRSSSASISGGIATAGGMATAGD